MKIVCDDKIPFLKGVFEPYAQVEYLKGAGITREDVRDADALVVRTRTRCDAALLAGSKVRIVATATIGYDHIDTDWCSENGIRWTNAPGCNSSSVRHYMASVLCTLSRRLGVRTGDITLGVVGVGHVGSKVAEAAEALGCRVLCNDPPRVRQERLADSRFVPLDTLLDACNVITLHVPLSDEGEDATRHLFDRARLARWLGEGRFRPLASGCRAVLINASRGPVADNEALLDAVKTTGLGTVLDTWEHEPDINRELLERCLIATPHIAGYSADGKANGTCACVRAVAETLGLPLCGWSPGDIPRTLPATLSVPAGGTAGEILQELVLGTYDVMQDDARLRQHPEDFEKLRGAYPLRRDIESYSVSLPDMDAETAGRLHLAGFQIKK